MEKGKNIQKFLTISFLVVSFLFVLLIMLFMFNNGIGEKFTTEVQSNQVVRIIVIAMTVLYFVCALALFIVLFFIKDTLSAMNIINEQNTSTKITRKAVVAIVKHNVQFVEGVRVKNVEMSLDSKGDVKLAVSIHVVYVPVDQVVEPFRCILYSAFYEILGIEFSSIDFKVTALKPKFTPDMEVIEKESNALKAKKERLNDKKKSLETQEQGIAAKKAAEEEQLRQKEIEELRKKEAEEKAAAKKAAEEKKAEEKKAAIEKAQAEAKAEKESSSEEEIIKDVEVESVLQDEPVDNDQETVPPLESEEDDNK